MFLAVIYQPKIHPQGRIERRKKRNYGVSEVENQNFKRGSDN